MTSMEICAEPRPIDKDVMDNLPLFYKAVAEYGIQKGDFILVGTN